MENRTEIATIGEFGLVNKIKNLFDWNIKNNEIGIGDDAALVNIPENEKIIISKELLIEGVHFDLAYCPLRHLGYKAVVMGISDIAAMNGSPKHILIGIALSNRFSVEAVEEFYFGVNTACEDFDISLIGGDTTSSPSGLTISVTAIGSANLDKITSRSGAKPNDILCVSGDLGGAFLGLQLLEREKQVFQANPDMQPELEGYDYIVQRQLKPTARMDIIYQLRDLGIVPTSMIDLSDGLASDLKHLCKASNVGATIYEEKLPIDDQTYLAATALNLSPITAALNGGEDFELLFTISQADYEKLKSISDINPIGFITDQADKLYLGMKSGEMVTLVAQGWK